MNTKEEKIQTGLRLSQSLNEEVEEMASEHEMSKNALMVKAIKIGLKNLKGVNPHCPCRQGE